MSYEKVRSISITKEGRIFITSACNNVRPLLWSKWEFCKDEDFEEKKFQLFLGIEQGNLHLEKSVSERIRYAFFEFNKHCIENKIDTYNVYLNSSKWLDEKIAKENNIEFVFESDNYNEEYRKKSIEITEIYRKLPQEERDKLYSISQHKVYDELYKKFLEFYNSYKKDNTKYIIKLDTNRFFKKLTTRHIKYSWYEGEATTFSKFEAEQLILQIKDCTRFNPTIIKLEG